MKKVITILLMTLLAWPAVAAQIRADGDGSSADIEKISVETVNDPGDERGGTAPVEAYLFHSTNTLYIALASSVGTATITVTDSFGTTVYHRGRHSGGFHPVRRSDRYRDLHAGNILG